MISLLTRPVFFNSSWVCAVNTSVGFRAYGGQVLQKKRITEWD